jgi:hypothetical protein
LLNFDIFVLARKSRSICFGSSPIFWKSFLCSYVLQKKKHKHNKLISQDNSSQPKKHVGNYCSIIGGGIHLKVLVTWPKVLDAVIGIQLWF